MIKKIFTSILIITLTQFSYAKENTKKGDEVVANVNGKPIYESFIKQKIEKFIEFNGLGSDPNFSYNRLDPEMKKDIIQNVVLGDLIIDEARKAKINETKEYKQAIKFTENQLMQKVFLEKTIKDAITEDKIKAAYDDIVKEQSNVVEYKVSHILVQKEAEAKEVKKKLDKGADFVALSKEYSIDNNKDNGGDLGYFSSGQMVQPFEQATERLKVGQISDPVKTDFGYHIIYLVDKRKMKVPSLEELRSKIEEELSSQFVQEYITKLKESNKVEFF
ncbi:MAG: peptidylprolyl isomerase [Rickettsiales bacterium]|nr:peptidylprolyl isomerase [Rickettsiales bacterium]